MGFDFLSVLIVLILKINTGSRGISDVHITGPSVLENGRQQWVDLTCSFTFASPEYKQLDIKWYFDNEEEPFLQWVPSAGRQPQTIGPRFRSRVDTRHVLTNTSTGYRTEQVIRVDKPSLVTSGEYTCKVATFTSEMIASHSLLIFEPGAGPFLSYSSTEADKVSVVCSVKQVFPEPRLSLTSYSEPEYDWTGSGSVKGAAADTSTTTVRRGMMYDVSVTSVLAPSVPHQTVFSCWMEIPGTQYSLVKKTMYSADTDIARARRVSEAWPIHGDPFFVVITSLTACLAFTYL